MRILETLTLRGPNIWSRRTVLEAWVDLEDLAERPSDSIPGFVDRLVGWLPSLVEHRCSVGERGGFIQRLRDGTYPAHILEHVTLELQCLAGSPVGFGKARETSRPGLYKVAVRYREELVAREALRSALALVIAAVRAEPFDVEALLLRLRALAERCRLDPATEALVAAAEARGIPTRRLGTGSLVLLGHGARQRRVCAAGTDRTGAIGESIVRDAELARTFLGRVGIPVPEARLVTHASDAWAAACEIGLPVSIRPADGAAKDHDCPLQTRDEVEAAFRAAASHGSAVVERWLPGKRHRLLVIGDRLVAAAPLEPGTDLTSALDPSLKAHALLAARVVGLDAAAIDIAAQSLSRPLEEQGGAVVAVSASLDLEPLAGPSAQTPPVAKGVAETIVEELFGPGEDGRIPVVSVTGTRGKTSVARLVAHLLRSTGRVVGLACSEGAFAGDRRIAAGDCARAEPARALLLNPSVEAAVFESGAESILREGLGFDRCQVAIVTNLGEPDHLGTCFIDSAEKMFSVKRCGVDVVLPSGLAVLKADDPLVAEMAELSAGAVTFFAVDGEHPVLCRHREQGKRAAFLRAGRLILAEGPAENDLGPLEALGLAPQARAFEIENALAAAAAVWWLRVPLDLIREGLASFQHDTTPREAGRSGTATSPRGAA